jgi:transposase InsO family protein
MSASFSGVRTEKLLHVCVYLFSKFVWLASVKESTSSATIRVLKDQVFANFSAPSVFVSDNATCFTSHELQQFCFYLGIKPVTTTHYYLQPSHAERFSLIPH